MLPADLAPVAAAVAAAILAILGLATVLLRRGRPERRELLRGARSGIIVALVVFAGGSVVAWAATGRLNLGVALGLAAGAAYLLLGLLVMLLGLAVPHSPSWATREAWLVTPVAVLLGVVGLGLGSGIGELANRPMTRAGQVALQLSGPGADAVSAQGQARCTLDDGNLAVHAGTPDLPALAASGDRTVAVQFGLLAGSAAHVVVTVGAAEAADATSPGARLELGPSSTANGGTLHFAGLVPRAAEPGASWAGELTWECPF